ncbi:Emopamil binding protein-domain-containing protein [Apodospora peruviana]|uniref:Emopamil binding protein-domain-containing protein n=1 Tax=Apodospora peruviana TaxID=516989 RepID=A0AAE0IBK2_9PEZI|nr:Emopamil binding protein-domain-containing protein [Apodospora peruviana]
MNMDAADVHQQHPYRPAGMSVAGYRPNETQLWILAGGFGVMINIFLAAGVKLLVRMKTLTRGEELTICWFLLNGFLHCFFEGYYITNYDNLAGSQHLFAQLWKEYAQSDSRYMLKQTFVLTIEFLTVVILGPLSFLTAICIARHSSIRHLVQVVVSVAHLYGVALYYGTCIVDERRSGQGYSRPEFLYFWVYYVGFNSPWVFVPSFLLYQSSHAIQRAFEVSERLTEVQKRK